MTIDREMLMAYADGELDPLKARRVERAIAADPALLEEVERHRALARRLRHAFGPVAEAPLPPAIEERLGRAAKLVPLPPRRVPRPSLRWGGAVAASLVVGLLAGQMIPRAGDDIAIEDGRPVARGKVADALSSQLASTQPADAPVRIGISFHDAGGRLCRTFQHQALGGIACADAGEWRLVRLYGGLEEGATQYRQAGSPSAAMMEDAAAMMAGEPLDAESERRAIRGS